MGTIKTQPGNEDVLTFLQQLSELKKSDCLILLEIMNVVTGLSPEL